MSEQANTPVTQTEIERQRKRFESAERKLNKLYEVIERFESNYPEAEEFYSWLENILKQREDIESEVSSFEALIAEKNSGVETQVEKAKEEIDNVLSDVDAKAGEFKEDLNNRLAEFSDLLDEKRRNEDEDAEERKNEVRELLEEARKSKEEIDSLEEASTLQKQKISDTEQRIERTLKDAEKALTSATAAGLAKEFEARRKSLSHTQKWWVAGLILSLLCALGIAVYRFNSIQQLLVMPEQTATSVIFLNFLISAITIAAPVWFAWVSTKQIGFCFRLSEDYGYKASLSAAYEGFRKEIEQLPQEEDSEMEDDLRIKLLDNILKTLDERPLRYVEQKVHGSPFHELMPFFKNKEQKSKPEENS